jgi:hypothetical protein
MRFLMKTLMVRPAPRLIHAFRHNPLWMRSACSAVFASSPYPGLGHLGVTGAAYIELIHLFARAQSYFSNLLLQPGEYPKIPRRIVCTPSLTVLYP